MRTDRDRGRIVLIAVALIGFTLGIVDTSSIELPFNFYKVEETGSILTINWEPWVALIYLIIGLPFLFATMYLLFKQNYRIVAAIPLFFVLIFHGILVPGILMDEVVVTNESIRQTTGFWFLPTRKGFQFSDVSFVKIGIDFDIKGRANAEWIVNYKDGKKIPIDPGDLWSDNSEIVINKIRKHGVTFEL